MRILKISITISALLFIITLFQTQTYLLAPSQSISRELEQSLFNLGSKAIENMDVPVAAVLIYDDSIIGTGYNTVNRDSDITRHAEVNCINMAFKSMGRKMYDLDREKLILYTTYEPCEMCKGVIINERIKRVYFEKRKGAWYQVKNTIKNLRYNMAKRQIDAPGLQESLFVLHPNYLKTREN